MRLFTSLTALSLSLAAALALPLATGCATSPDADTASLEIPLVQPGPDGALYRLFAAFRIDGPSGTQFLDGTGDEPTVSLTLPPGLISVQLLDGWTLQRSTDGGVSYLQVPAIVGSLNPMAARIQANLPNLIGFQFILRETTGDLMITFGVTPAPRELAGGVVINADPSQATGLYDVYAGRRLDFAVFYDLFSVDSATLADGTKDRAYTADAVALEYYNDPIGLLSSVAPAMSGGFLVYHVAAHPDGTQTISGSFDGGNAPFSTLVFGPHVLPTNVPLDADGFPTDVFIFDSFVPFTFTTFFDAAVSSITGELRFRSIPGPR